MFLDVFGSFFPFRQDEKKLYKRRKLAYQSIVSPGWRTKVLPSIKEKIYHERTVKFRGELIETGVMAILLVS